MWISYLDSANPMVSFPLMIVDHTKIVHDYAELTSALTLIVEKGHLQVIIEFKRYLRVRDTNPSRTAAAKKDQARDTTIGLRTTWVPSDHVYEPAT